MNKKKFFVLISVSLFLLGFIWSNGFKDNGVIAIDYSDSVFKENLDSLDMSNRKWTPIQVVSTESTEPSRYPSVAVDQAGNIHVAWEDGTDYNGAGPLADIFYKSWDATSQTWSITEVVSTESTGGSTYPSLAVDAAGNVHIAWLDWTDYAGSGPDDDIFYKSRDATSQTWSITEVVSTESTDTSSYPSLVADVGGNIHVVWHDQTDYAGAGTDSDIFYKSRDTTSQTWSITEIVSTESPVGSEHPSLVVGSTGNLHIAWYDGTDYDGAGTDWDIFYKSRDATSQTWSIIEVVSTASTDFSYHPSIAVDQAENVHITWFDRTDYTGAGTDWDIFHNFRDTSSQSWRITQVVSSESTGDSMYPSVAVDQAGNVHVLWDDNTDLGCGTDYDIFYNTWDASLQIWLTTQLVSTESTEYSREPSVAVDQARNIHMVWYDQTNYTGSGTDNDIFYRQLIAAPPAPDLAFILPNPSSTGEIHLDWNDIASVSEYYVYRSSAYIWTTEGLSPIDITSENDYIDNIDTNGFYYYTIVASNFAGNSSHSNCQYVEVQLAVLDTTEETTFTTGLIVSVTLLFIVKWRFHTRKK